MPMRTLPSLLLFAPLLWLAPLALVACGDDDAPATDAQRADMRRQVDLQDMDRIDSSDPLDSGEAADEGALDQSLSDVRDAERDRGAEEEDQGVERDQGDEEMSQEGALYVGSGDVFAPGALAVTSSALKITELDVTLWAPQQAGRYAVVVFQHGFLMSASYYASLLERVASHGFIVIAPQMYEAGGLPLGKPSAPQEAASALALWQALPAALPAALPPAVDAELSRLGLVGHSRGAKVTWLNLVADPTLALAAVGLDPVDSAGTFLASEPRAIPEAGLSFSLPSLFIGTGLGPRGGGAFTPACAPAEDGYMSFYAGAKAPAYQIVATEYGHLDMLEDDPAGCGLACGACEDGAGPRAAMRAASAGWIVALMRSALQGSDESLGALTGVITPPVMSTFEWK